MVSMTTDLGVLIQPLAQRPDTGRDVIRQHVAGRIRAIDAIGSVRFHQPGLFQQLLRLHHVGHHQEADCIQVNLSGGTDVLFGDIRFRAVGSYANGMNTAITGHVQMIHGADPGQ